jgi:hypothetical protein
MMMTELMKRHVIKCKNDVLVRLSVTEIQLSLLTPWSTVLLDKLTVVKLLQKFPAFFGP